MFGNTGNQVFRAVKNNVSALSKIVENISNVNSIGYKKGRMSFAQTLDGEIAKHDEKDFSQGPLRRTGDVYDLAINGPGFFEIELPSGQRAYTRVGRFRLSSEGELVTGEGYRVIPEVEQVSNQVLEVGKSEGENLGVSIKVSTPKISISSNQTPEITEDGTVSGIDSTTNEKSKIGKIRVVIFNNPQGLELVGKGHFVPTNSSGQPIEAEAGPDKATTVKQGYVEFGNVDIATEFMNLSQAKDLLSAQFKLLKAIDKLYESVHYTISKSA